MKTILPLRPLAILATSLTLLSASPRLSAQSFSSLPAGDDITPSLGQFQLVLDSVWRRTFDNIMTNGSLGDTLVTRHIRLYHRGVFTSPTLYDPATTIGRSDAFVSGGPEEFAGLLAGHFPGRTYIRDNQMIVRPNWLEAPAGVHEIHTFLKRMHLVDSFTTQLGFSVKAGMLAPTRPVCAGQVEGDSTVSDYPARSFFNVYVVVDLPAGGPLPPIQLVNVDPLLVQQTNLFTLPPRVVYQHENSTAVPMYFNTDVVLHDPLSGDDIPVTRGTLFGQLTLAGHGVGFGSVEVESFQNEIENESEHGGMPLNPDPFTHVVIQDFAPDYEAAPPALTSATFAADGSFHFTLTHLAPGLTNYIQARSSLSSGAWQTIATIVPATNHFDFVDSDAINHQHRFYRWTQVP